MDMGLKRLVFEVFDSLGDCMRVVQDGMLRVLYRDGR